MAPRGLRRRRTDGRGLPRVAVAAAFALGVVAGMVLRRPPDGDAIQTSAPGMDTRWIADLTRLAAESEARTPDLPAGRSRLGPLPASPRREALAALVQGSDDAALAAAAERLLEDDLGSGGRPEKLPAVASGAGGPKTPATGLAGWLAGHRYAAAAGAGLGAGILAAVLMTQAWPRWRPASRRRKGETLAAQAPGGEISTATHGATPPGSSRAAGPPLPGDSGDPRPMDVEARPSPPGREMGRRLSGQPPSRAASSASAAASDADASPRPFPHRPDATVLGDTINVCYRGPDPRFYHTWVVRDEAGTLAGGMGLRSRRAGDVEAVEVWLFDRGADDDDPPSPALALVSPSASRRPTVRAALAPAPVVPAVGGRRFALETSSLVLRGVVAGAVSDDAEGRLRTLDLDLCPQAKASPGPA